MDDSVDSFDCWERTALMRAAADGQAATIGCLLDAGADVNLQDEESGYTALHWALFRCHLVAAAALIHRGARMHAPLDHEGLSPVELMLKRFGQQRSVTSSRPLGDVLTWGHAGGAALGRGVSGASHAVAVGRVELPAATLLAASVATAKHHMLVVDEAGGLHSCGLGVGGRLGHGDERQVSAVVAHPYP